MKSKTKRIISVLLAALIMTCTAAGCADRENVPIASGTGDAAATTETLPSKDGEGNTADMPGTGECPEGYVYDYQVSMEPIPEEIAALGGPCEGTIHAFPSRIGMALTELEMEKDPVLKAEVEKRIPEIEAALEEEIGGEFVVDGVILLDDLFWVFFCTEVETGYQFDLYYGNKEYYAYIRGNDSTENIISVADYYEEKESIPLRETLVPVIEEIYTGGDIKVRLQKGGSVVDIAIAQYGDKEIDKCLEQEKVLLIWETLQSYNNTYSYNINITFYPSRYEDVIHTKYCAMRGYDFGRVYSEEIMVNLAKRGEIRGCFDYTELWDGENDNNLDVLLQQHKDGNNEQDEIWEYWIP